MCWHCNNPSATREEYLDVLRTRIDTNGWTIQYVEGEGRHSPFAYTIGLTTLNLPELVVTGTTPYRAAEILHTAAGHFVHSCPLEPGEWWMWEQGEEFEAVEVAVPDAHLLKAVELFGSGVQGLQIVYTDDRGNWPWEVGYRTSKWAQNLLGPRASEVVSGNGGHGLRFH